MITLRAVHESDLGAFFEHQRDPEALAMAVFAARERAPFLEHWRRIMADADAIVRTVELDGEVVGNIVSWRNAGRRYVGYWLAREVWGRGVATTALGLFAGEIDERPLYAWVADTNVGSRRVLEKNGFRAASPQPPAEADDVPESLFELV